MQLIKGVWRHLIPSRWRHRIFDLREHFRVQQIENGHWRSVSTQSSVDMHGDPLPWISYPAIEYLNQLDFSTKTVFEYGAGNSTMFWVAIAKQVVSVESDTTWYERVRQKLMDCTNVDFKLVTEKAAYVSHIAQYPPFDVVFIDGIYRLECAEAAIEHVSPQGMIILDNSETHSEVATLLRNAGFIQVDMIGFAPIVPKVQATSFFLRRDFAFAPRLTNQPSNVIGKRWVSAPNTN